MLAMTALRRTRQLAVTLIAATAFAACDDDDPVEPDDEPGIASVRLIVGTDTAIVTTTSAGTLDVASGANTVAAEWFKADGSVETLVTNAEFELRIQQASGTGTLGWTATGARSGTLTVTGLAAGASIAAQVIA